MPFAILKIEHKLLQSMPKKVGELKRLLKKSGFIILPKRGKGSHSYWIHPLLSKPIVLSGKDSKDALALSRKGCNEKC